MNYMEFDKDQSLVYSHAMQGDSLFVSGGAGVGKTFVIQKTISDLRAAGKNVIVSAYTMAAALNLDPDNGMTILKAFNTFNDGLKFDEEGLRRLRRSAAYKADIIIIDVISLCSASLFTYICMAIRRISMEHEYKDIPLIVLGDFLQLPPICGRWIEPEFAFESKWWKIWNFNNILLETPHRQQNLEYVTHLNQIRKGQSLYENIKYLKNNAHYLERRDNAITLCSYRNDVQTENNKIINKLAGDSEYFYADTDTNDPSLLKEFSVWNTLEFKKGTFVMTTYNDPEGRYYNGPTGQIIDDEKGSFYVEQLPVIPAYSLTIHKAQGCTLDYVNVNPRCFTDGQLYVALSRVKDVSHLYITDEIKINDIKVNEKVLEFYETLNYRTAG